MSKGNAILPRDKGAAPLGFRDRGDGVPGGAGAGRLADRRPRRRRLAATGLPASSPCRFCRRTKAMPRQVLDARNRCGRRRAARHAGHRPCARRCRDAEIDALVEPWLGKDGLVADIPLPRLIDATIAPGADVDVAALAARLKQAAPHATAGRSQPLDRAAAAPRRHGALFRLWHPAADRRRHRGGGVLRHARGPGRASRDGGAAAPDGRACRASSPAPWSGIISFRRLSPRCWARCSRRCCSWARAGWRCFGVEAVPFLPPLSLSWTEMPWLAGGAGRHRADRLGHGADFGAFGRAGHLLNFARMIRGFFTAMALVALAYASGFRRCSSRCCRRRRDACPRPTASWR